MYEFVLLNIKESWRLNEFDIKNVSLDNLTYDEWRNSDDNQIVFLASGGSKFK